MNFNNNIPEWKNAGTEPSEQLKKDGFSGGYKPPAGIFNWFFSLVQKCVTELQTKISNHDGNIVKHAPEFTGDGTNKVLGLSSQVTGDEAHEMQPISIGNTNDTYRFVCNYTNSGLTVTANSLSGLRFTTNVISNGNLVVAIDDTIVSNEMRSNNQTVIVIARSAEKPPVSSAYTFTNAKVYTPIYGNAPVWKDTTPVIDNLTSTSTTSALSANQGKILDEKKANFKNATNGFNGGNRSASTNGGAIGINAIETGGGFAGGASATARNGGAIGNTSSTIYGGSVGMRATSTSGGAVGSNTITSNGFAGGNSAKTTDAEGTAIDAIQLGTGTNNTAKTLQVYDYTLMNANGTIPAERLANAPKTTVVNNLTSTSTTSALSGNMGRQLNEQKANKQTEGEGFAGGDSAFAIGGGAIGKNACTSDGFAGGKNAQTIDSKANYIDAVQLGEGTNNVPKSMQVYDFQMMDAEGNVPTNRLKYAKSYTDSKIEAVKSEIDADMTEKDGTVLSSAKAYADLTCAGKANQDSGSGGFEGGRAIASGSGCAIGAGASATNGAALGNSAIETDEGGAVGCFAEASSGGAVGFAAKASRGFSGGYDAKAINAEGTAIDAIQLGTGTNSTAKSLQVYNYQLMDANGNIPASRLTNAPKTTVVDNLTSTSTTSALSANQGKILDEKKADFKNTNGGFNAGLNSTASAGAAVGNNATTTSGGAIGRDSSSTSGAAVGYNTSTHHGAAVGSIASSTAGGAVGNGTDTTEGGAVGFNAHSATGGAIGSCTTAGGGGAVGYRAITSNGFAGGYNAKAVNTSGNAIDAVQLGTGTNNTAKSLQVYDYTLMNADGKIPAERLINSVAGKTLSPEEDTTAVAATGAEIFNDYRERTYTSDTYNAQTGNVAVGTYSHAEGMATTAKGQQSHAEGLSTVAAGTNSHAEGAYTFATGDMSHAEGNDAYSRGWYSHSEGCVTNAYGACSHAEGYWSCAGDPAENESNFLAAHAEGYGTKAAGTASHSEGFKTYAIGNYQHAGGRYNTVKSGPGSTEDMTGTLFVIGNGTLDTNLSNAFRVDANGTTYASSWAQGGADYAELFEWLDGNENNENRRGRFVTLVGDKIRFATSEDDYILGVVSAAPGVLGDVYDDTWHGMYLKDVFGNRITEVVETEDRTETHFVLNPDYNHEQEYIPRTCRPEWDAVGMLGKLVVIDDGTCEVNGYCSVGENGIATTSTNGYRVMARLDENHIKILLK